MKGRAAALASVLAVCGLCTQVESAVLCVKKQPKTGQINDNSPVRARAACRANEILLDAAALGLQAPQATLGFSPTASFADVTLSNVLINGGAITPTVAPGSTVNVSVGYSIVDTGCPGCIDQIQVGFAHESPTTCIYDSVPGTTPDTGTAGFTLTAPTAPGTYYLGFDRSQAFSCPAGWWSGAPQPFRYFGTITVQ
jgi:hypothetical protein